MNEEPEWVQVKTKCVCANHGKQQECMCANSYILRRATPEEKKNPDIVKFKSGKFWVLR